jgi:uncharacterized membrane protein YGL010W
MPRPGGGGQLLSFFAQQLATYATYHRDPRNRATHFVGIPAIIFSILLPFALWRFHLFSVDASAAWVVALLAVARWIALDVTVGLAMAVVMLPMLVTAEWVAMRFGATTAWLLFAVFFVGGWTFQLVGHAFEGRRPALADNLFQGFIGPMFIMTEVLIALGFKPELKAVLDATPPKAA